MKAFLALALEAARDFTVRDLRQTAGDSGDGQ
jgi:hypothetical protein